MTGSASRSRRTVSASPTPGSTPPAAAPRPPPGARRSRSSAGLHLFDAARIGAAAIAAELGGLSPAKLHAAELAADALARALGAAARDRARLAPPAEGTRTLVAMSGGVDSSVAALLCARDSETLAVTLELWADPENDAEQSCCSSSAVAQARALAHSLGLPHFTIDLRDEFRAGVVEPFIAGYAGGETPEPVRRLQRARSPRRDARARGAARRGAARDGALRARSARRTTPLARCSGSPPTRRRTRRTCSPRLTRRASLGCAFRSAS